MSKDLDPAVARILAALLEAHEGTGSLPVGRLRKQLGFPLAVVMRALCALIDAKLVELTRLQDQNIGAGLTPTGLGLARRHQRPSD